MSNMRFAYIFGVVCTLALGASAAAYTNQLPLVLVHGAAVDGSCWEPVKPLLHAPAIANPSQRGRTGNQPNADPATITFAEYIQDLETVVNQTDKGNGVILVGHSFGGLLISQVGENLGPNRIRALIYVAAYIPATGTVAGDSFASHLAADTNSVIPQWATNDPNGAWVTVNNASAVFLNDCPNDATTTAQANTIQAIKEPTAPFATNATYSANNFGKIPKYYISTSLDTAVSPGFQQLQYTHLQMVNVTTIEAGHAPMVCKSQVFADALNSLTADISYAVLPPNSGTTGSSATSPASILVAGGLSIVAAVLSLL
eukprot:Phypoly_transcript_07157.p1 GENE.Phypoly_transcript_07157~~Phypoly_transcript_07157.p1  ORF type:complete len:315 (+),score=62.46 Phypoly_transcript_07157:709-1653(+)